MKKFLVLATLLYFSTLSVGRVDAISLSLDPVSQAILPGGTAAVDLSISGLAAGGAPSLGAFRVEVTFDPSILTFDSVAFGGFLGFPTDPFETDVFVDTTLPGAVLLDEFSFLFDFELDALQPDAFTLASLSFTGSGLGVGTLGYGLVDLSDGIGFTLTPSLTTASVSVVPEPGTFLLLASGIVGLIGFSWRRKQAG